MHVKVHPSIKVIGMDAFNGCTQLINLELSEGLECIKEETFQGCTSLQHIIIPSTVKRIGQQAFLGCRQLRNVKLCEGLDEQIEYPAFEGCTLLYEGIRRLPSVEECGAFRGIGRY